MSHSYVTLLALNAIITIIIILQVLQNDFFLVGCVEDFINNGRMLIFETFIRIHQCISIKYVHIICKH